MKGPFWGSLLIPLNTLNPKPLYAPHLRRFHPLRKPPEVGAGISGSVVASLGPPCSRGGGGA